MKTKEQNNNMKDTFRNQINHHIINLNLAEPNIYAKKLIRESQKACDAYISIFRAVGGNVNCNSVMNK